VDLHKGQLVIGTDHAETVAKDVALNADKVFVDYRPTAENENATIKMLLADGQKYEELVDGDLLQLTSEEVVGRNSDDEIIFFQSLGVLNENLAAAEYFYNKLQNQAQEVEI
jgi:ornithine cyclodeaminase